MDTSLVSICNKWRLCDVVIGDIGKNKSIQKCVGIRRKSMLCIFKTTGTVEVRCFESGVTIKNKKFKSNFLFSHLRQINKKQL